MKVLHLNTNDTVGGAARTAIRLHKGLRARGVESLFLAQDKQGDDATVLRIGGGKVSQIWRRVVPLLERMRLSIYRDYNGMPWSLNKLPRSVHNDINKLSPDIVHLHWVCGGFLPFSSLAKLQGKVVWTFHDSWPFTGGCHVPYPCLRYREECGQCPQLGSRLVSDISRASLRMKKKFFMRNDITIVTPSKWLRDCVQSSSVLRACHVEVIPNGIDLSLYRPVDKSFARELLGLPKDKLLILAGAVGALSDPNKGGEQLISAIENLSLDFQREVELVIFGTSSLENIATLPIPARSMGRLHDDFSLVLLYSAADVFVCPSIQENLPTTVIEASACGTPSVAFSTSGLPDVIRHNETGYLARPFDTVDLANGISWILKDSSRNIELGRKARLMAEECFDIRSQSERYLNLYKNVSL